MRRRRSRRAGRRAPRRTARRRPGPRSPRRRCRPSRGRPGPRRARPRRCWRRPGQPSAVRKRCFIFVAILCAVFMVLGKGDCDMATMTTAAISTGHDEQERDRAAAPHVLIAVDDTPAARRTLASGLADAAVHAAGVTVLHVAPPRRWRASRLGAARAVPVRLTDPLESPVLRDARRLAFDHGISPRLELVAAD